MQEQSLLGAAGRLPTSRRKARAASALAVLCAALVACGGGGGGGTVIPVPGALKVTVADKYGTKVAGATVQATQSGQTASGVTDGQGVALIATNWPAGTAATTITVSGPTFKETTVVQDLTSGQVGDLVLELPRATAGAGGSIGLRSGNAAIVSENGRRLTFDVELVIVDADSVPIANLAVDAFTLLPCTPDAATTKPNCINGGAGDAAYDAVDPRPQALGLVAGQPPSPYAAALLLDQSGSIFRTDPTLARLYSAKAFLDGLGDSDRAVLAAFADGPNAIIPTAPLTVYAPSRDRATANGYFPTLDGLAQLIGGDTPLYASVESLVQAMKADATIPATLPKSIVVFTDGDDTSCNTPATCAANLGAAIQRANADNVRIFAIGLGGGVNFESLGKLANDTGGALLYADSAEQLISLYGSVGRLLSLSLPTYRLRFSVRAAADGSFASGTTLLGRVRVTAPGNSFEVPIIVAVP